MLLNDDAPAMIDGVIAQSGGTLTSFVGYATGERNSVAVNQRISQLCAKFTNACDTTSLIADQITALRKDSRYSSFEEMFLDGISWMMYRIIDKVKSTISNLF